MTAIFRNDPAAEHLHIRALLPWYLNGSSSEGDVQRVEAHLAQCADCREELAQERRIHEAMSGSTAVEYMPAASLKRLQARLDGVQAAPSGAVQAAPRRRALPWQGLLAASVALMALAIGLLSADRWQQLRARAAAPDYYTVTSAVPRAPNEVIRAVFAPALTLAELQAILDDSQLTIVAGPTEAGVYSLASSSRRQVSESLKQLRANSKVRFAETTQPRTGSGASP